MHDYDVHTRQINRSIKSGSLSAMLVIMVALGITLIGVREVLYPAICARQFGVPLLDPQDGDWLAIKAARDVVSGILAVRVLGLRNPTILTYAFGVLTHINSLAKQPPACW
jgi:hypothetical protein